MLSVPSVSLNSKDVVSRADASWLGCGLACAADRFGYDHGQRFFGLNADDIVFRFQVTPNPLRRALDRTEDDVGQVIGHMGAIA